jgi:hypothetical protein
MTQDEIIEMAKEAGINTDWEISAYKNELQHFAKLVAEKSYYQGWKDCMDEHLIPRIEFNPKDSV